MSLIKSAGELDTPITIAKQTTKPNAVGVPVATIEPLFDTWAQVRTQFIKDVLKSYGTDTDSVIVLVVRSQQPQLITTSMMVIIDGVTYKITKVAPDTVNFEWDTIYIELMSGK